MSSVLLDDTIVAQCTPRGPGAIAVIRISGPDALTICSNIAQLPQKKNLCLVSSHTVHYGWIIENDGTKVDQVLFTVMKSPHSFTGETVVEIGCHNNSFICERIVERAIEAGARLADPGEFSKRAVLNKKIDLIQAEAINELVHAHNQLSLKQSLSQLEGSLSHVIKSIENTLVEAAALTNASFEFLEDESITFDEAIRTLLTTVTNDIDHLKKNFSLQQHIRNGIRIALIGSSNAGKSTLFNTLLGTKRSIVTDIPGTTRDTIEGNLHGKISYRTYVDTAGLRSTNDIIEQEGIRRSREEAEQSDITLLIFDLSRPLKQSEINIYQEIQNKYQNKTIVIGTKSDIAPSATKPSWPLCTDYCTVSSSTGHGIKVLQEKIDAKEADIFLSASAPFFLNKRQYNILCRVQTIINQAAAQTQRKTINYEVIAYHLTEAITCCAELTGATVSENCMNKIFQSFCVGK